MDKRRHLKVKIKNLAEEARIIRHEERKVRGMDKWELQHHRKTVVRDEARRSQVAYAIIRGKDPAPSARLDSSGNIVAEDLPSVKRMVAKYGSSDLVKELDKAA